jgi:acylglycerol lipase
MQHHEGTFTGSGGLTLYWQRWLPEGTPRATLLLAHGYAEHSGRYANVVDHFVPRGYAIYALDHRGHGKSEGARVEVDAVQQYIDDLKTFHDLTRAEQPQGKLFLVGHSMGAFIATSYTLQFQHELDGLVLSGGGINTPNAPARPANLALADTLSRDPAVAEAYRNDPLVYLGPPPDRSALAAFRERLPAEVPAIRVPILVMAGEDSPLGDGPRSRALYEAVGSEDKTLLLWPDLLHEIFNEPEHPQVLGEMEQWLEARL